MVVTALLALLGAVLGSAGTVIGQRMVANSQIRSAEMEREIRGDERAEQRREQDRKDRREIYGALSIAGSAFREAVREAPPAEFVAELAALRRAVVIVQLQKPTGPVTESLHPVMTTADRLVSLRRGVAPVNTVHDATRDFDDALAALVQAMRDDIAPGR